jgi:hypothetical protein
MQRPSPRHVRDRTRSPGRCLPTDPSETQSLGSYPSLSGVPRGFSEPSSAVSPPPGSRLLPVPPSAAQRGVRPLLLPPSLEDMVRQALCGTTATRERSYVKSYCRPCTINPGVPRRLPVLSDQGLLDLVKTASVPICVEKQSRAGTHEAVHVNVVISFFLIHSILSQFTVETISSYVATLHRA